MTKRLRGQQPSGFKHPVDGVERLDRKDLLSRLSSVAGQPFSEFSVAVDRDTILAQYFTRGFPNATFEWNSQPSPGNPNHMDVQYVVQEGQQQFVRQRFQLRNAFEVQGAIRSLEVIKVCAA